jgi:hypothetical protein
MVTLFFGRSPVVAGCCWFGYSSRQRSGLFSGKRCVLIEYYSKSRNIFMDGIIFCVIPYAVSSETTTSDSVLKPFAVTFPPELMALVDEHAARQDLNRSQLFRKWAREKLGLESAAPPAVAQAA